ncbi:MAG TPA: AcvB/VirJ family lysyl-phosphatidylglycerol hydrolase [Gammaproteobacteria bacterium]|nr:AcvB/VirJ family lysyl-phosphatidylglycerol hydrolase [Gammaproteobacteria bacterium]
MDGRAVASMLAAALLCLWSALAAASAADPFVRLPAAAGTDGPLVLLLTGDGDWAPFPRGFAETAVAAGSPVLGLKTRTYLAHRARTPEQIAADLEGPVRAELAASHRDALVIVGYSRGADWTAFVVNRWPEDLRERIRAIAFVGLSEHASFAFHFDDLFRDIARPTDVPTRPEVEKLSGIPMICAYGEDEDDTLCKHPVPGMRVVEHTGAHRVKDDTDLIALLLRELGIGSGAAPSSREQRP